MTAPPAGAPRSARERLGLLDAVKATACLMIVAHHLAFYGPMSDVARPLAPELMDWFAEYARIAVQVFLAASGFLVARSLGFGRSPVVSPWRLIGLRYLRLVLPYAGALLLAILASALARELMDSPSIPGPPSLAQLAAHLLLLHDLLGFDALSAGVWYVAIDFQLFSLTVLLCWVGERVRPWSALRGVAPEVCCMAVLVAASLLWFNLDTELDVCALYFIGAYGLGVLAGWSTRAAHPRLWLAAIGVLGLFALVVDWRERIAVALVCALCLGGLQAAGRLAAWQPPRWVAKLGQASYVVFLVHFPVCLVVNALWSHAWPAGPAMNLVGMVAALGLSVMAGCLLHRVELRVVRLARGARASARSVAAMAAGDTARPL